MGPGQLGPGGHIAPFGRPGRQPVKVRLYPEGGTSHQEGRSVPLDRRGELAPGSSGTIGRPLPAAGHQMHFRTNDGAK